MATPTMVYTGEIPGAESQAGQLQIDLIAGAAGTVAWAGTDDIAVYGTELVTLEDGVATIANMRPNSGSSSDVITTPANSVYRGILHITGGRTSAPFYFTVPDVAGTHQIFDYLTELPTDLPWWTRMWATFQQAGELATGQGAFRFYFSGAFTIQSVRASVSTAPTGSSLIVDVNLNGTTIFTGGTGRPTIAAGDNTATGTPAVTAVASGDYLTVDIDQIGSTVPGSNLVVQVELA